MWVKRSLRIYSQCSFARILSERMRRVGRSTQRVSYPTRRVTRRLQSPVGSLGAAVAPYCGELLDAYNTSEGSRGNLIWGDLLRGELLDAYNCPWGHEGGR